MKSFHWDQHFITGLPEIDQQHHRLVDIINKFSNLLARNQLVFSDIKAVFRELFEYAEYHFKEEEGMMCRMGIDQRHLDGHIEAHQIFLQEITSMQTNISPDNLQAAQNMIDFLARWLAYHILGSDQNMARQINSIQSGISASEAYKLEERMTDNATEPLLIALKGLFQQVSARNKELKELNKSLEDTISKRTKALSEANLQLEELALTDTLTKLPNRRHAMRRLAYLWDESVEAKAPMVCMMIDADNFKEVNDTYGHDAGDAVLRALANAFQETVRSDDIVCRLGGDEFLIICPNTDQRGGMHVAEFICEKISSLSIKADEGVWYGSVSVGIAVRSPDMENHKDLLKMADRGVYIAKRDGKNLVRSAS